MRDRTIGIGYDRGGFELKEELERCLLTDDYGATDKRIETLYKVDYPDVAVAVASGVTAGEYDYAILICSTGIGVSIAANEVPGIRTTLCNDCFSARMAGEHDNANIITLGARIVEVELTWGVVKNYPGASFLRGKHQVRVDRINHL